MQYIYTSDENSFLQEGIQVPTTKRAASNYHLEMNASVFEKSFANIFNLMCYCHRQRTISQQSCLKGANDSCPKLE